MPPLLIVLCLLWSSASLPGQERAGSRASSPGPLWEQLDADGNGRISATEAKRLVTILRSLDRNRDGWVTKDELGRNRKADKSVGRGRGRAEAGGVAGSFRIEVPSRTVDIILGRPTDRSVTLSVLAYRDIKGQVFYGLKPGSLRRLGAERLLTGGEPVTFQLKSLLPNRRYYYRFKYQRAGPSARREQREGTFHTCRAENTGFVFTVQADSHLDEGTDPSVYARTLTTALGDRPDFHIDLGDTFMTGKYGGRYEEARKQYLAQRYYFGLLCHSAPLFLVLGNHDGETGGQGVEAALMRKTYFPNPYPGSFYTGNSRRHPTLGHVENYYAWKWGGCLFMVLDPFWYTRHRKRGSGNGWSRTLGREQYEWLARTLKTKARFKFVFIHHLVGGMDRNGRGGKEAAGLYEWGGKNPDGSPGFKVNRPGWSHPIHRLLVQNKVDILFHGHDHFYAKQELDGVIYQLVPQPGHPSRNRTQAGEYGYRSGTFIPSPGYLRIDVNEPGVTVDYMRIPTGKIVARVGTVPAYSYFLTR